MIISTIYRRRLLADPHGIEIGAMSMSFRITVRTAAGADIRENKECQTVSEAFALYRRLVRARFEFIEIIDLREGSVHAISSAELEAIAQSEQHGRFRTAWRVAVGDAPLSTPIS